MSEKLTKEGLLAFLEGTQSPKVIKEFVRNNKFDVPFKKGMTIADAKALIVEVLFPPEPEPDPLFDDDDFDDDFGDDDFGDDDFAEDDLDGSDSDIEDDLTPEPMSTFKNPADTIIEDDPDSIDDPKPADEPIDPDFDDPIDTNENPEDDPEAIDTLEVRITQLEQRIEEIHHLVTKKKTKKISNVDKDKIKAELLNNFPYTQEEIDKLNGKEVRMLASALNVNSFGRKIKDIKKDILGTEYKKG